MTVRVVYWPRIPLAKQLILSGMGEQPDAELVVCESVDDMPEALAGAQGMILSDTGADEAKRILEMIRAASSLRWMHFVTAGSEGFDAAGLPDSVTVTRPGLGVSPGVAEHAMALLLGVVRQLPAVAAATVAREWDRSLGPAMRSIEGMWVAIVGTGKIGREIARRAAGFDCEVVGVARGAREEPGFARVVAIDEADALWPETDAVVAAVPLTDKTRRIFGEAFFGRLRRGAFFVNVSRGGVVDQKALAEALRSGALAGAGLDVTEPEPLPADSPLWTCPNTLISAHLSGAGNVQNQQRIAGDVTENFERLLRDGHFATH